MIELQKDTFKKVKKPIIESTLILLFIITLNTTLLAEKIVNTDIDSFSIKKTSVNSDNISVRQTNTYDVTFKDCKLAWVVSVPTDEMRQYENLTLYPKSNKCELPFDQQFPAHRAVFNAIFKDWDKKDFSGLRTPSVRKLAPNRSLSLKIALASIESEDYKDYRKNYPNHKTRKHINDIFVDILNSIMVYKQLDSHFREHGLSIKLTGVEKVFGDTVKNLKKYDKTLYNLLVRKGVSDKQRVLYDAGIFYFKITSETPTAN